MKASIDSLQTRTPAASWLRVSLLLIACGLMAVAAIGCGTSKAKGPAAKDAKSATTTAMAAAEPAFGTTESTNTLLLRPGATVKVAFEGDTNMTTVTKIQVEGYINLPFVGDVKASGKTIDELRADLVKRYESILKLSEVTVTLLDPNLIVTVSGAVLKAGPVSMDRPLTALEAISLAGGHDAERARLDKVTVMRTENGQTKVYKVNIRRTMSGREAPFYLKPYDVIYVPQKIFNL